MTGNFNNLNPDGLEVGSEAPDFTVTDVRTGQTFNLKQALESHRGILINFFRGSFWTFWRAFFKKLSEDNSTFETHDVKVIIIGPDHPDNLRKMNTYGFVNVSDPEREITKNYNTLTVNPLPGDAMFKLTDLPIPITFLLKGNGDGKIVWKYVGTKEIRPENKDIFDAISRYLY